MTSTGTGTRIIEIGPAQGNIYYSSGGNITDPTTYVDNNHDFHYSNAAILTCPTTNPALVGFKETHGYNCNYVDCEVRVLECSKLPTGITLDESKRTWSAPVVNKAQNPDYECPAGQVATGLAYTHKYGENYVQNEYVSIQCAPLVTGSVDTSNSYSSPDVFKSAYNNQYAEVKCSNNTVGKGLTFSWIPGTYQLEQESVRINCVGLSTATNTNTQIATKTSTSSGSSNIATTSSTSSSTSSSNNNNNNNNSGSSSSSSSTNPLIIVGAVLGSVLVIGIIGYVIFKMRKK